MQAEHRSCCRIQRRARPSRETPRPRSDTATRLGFVDGVGGVRERGHVGRRTPRPGASVGACLAYVGVCTHARTHTHTSCARTRTYTAWRAPPASLTAAHPLWQAEEALRSAAWDGRDAEVQEGIAKGVNVNAADEVSGRARQREWRGAVHRIHTPTRAAHKLRRAG